MIHIFDLDGTVIDSSHRQNYDLKTGALNLEHWRENSTREKIMGDSLMPLADYWRSLLTETNDYVMVCTARVCTEHDLEFLNIHGLYAQKIFSRKEGDSSRDFDLKVRQLNPYLQLNQFRNQTAIMYDDNQSVRNAVGKIGIIPVNPVEMV